MRFDLDPVTHTFPLHARALRRHADWAHDFARVGDDDAASEALRDFRAVAGELSGDDES